MFDFTRPRGNKGSEPDSIDSMIDRAAQEEGVPVQLFRSLVQHESSGNQNAVSPAGAIGLTQLMPGTAQGLGVNPYDPWENLIGGARYLKEQLDRFGDPKLALAAYNAGPGAVEKYGGVPPYSETVNYVANVLRGIDVDNTSPAIPIFDFTRKRTSESDIPGSAPSDVKAEKASLPDIPGDASPEVKALAARLFVEPSPERVSPVASPAPAESEVTSKLREFLGEEYSSPSTEELTPPLRPNESPEFAERHPVLRNVLAQLTAPAKAFFENPWVERAGQTGAEVMTMVDQPGKASTGGKLGDISADIWGSLMGFAANPAGGIESAGAKLWGGTEQAIERAIPFIPKVNTLPDIVQTGVRLGATTIPYEATMAAVNEREFDPGEAAVSATVNALLGAATHGAGRLIEARTKGAPDITQDAAAPPVVEPVPPVSPKPAVDIATPAEIERFLQAPPRSGGRVWYPLPETERVKLSPEEADYAVYALRQAAKGYEPMPREDWEFLQYFQGRKPRSVDLPQEPAPLDLVEQARQRVQAANARFDAKQVEEAKRAADKLFLDMVQGQVPRDENFINEYLGRKQEPSNVAPFPEPKPAPEEGLVEKTARRVEEGNRRWLERQAEEGKAVKYKGDIYTLEDLDGFLSQTESEISKMVDDMARYLRKEYAAATKETKDVYQLVRERGGIAPSRTGYLREEYNLSVPIGLRNRNGIPVDEMADELGMTTSELLEAIKHRKPVAVGKVADFRRQAEQMLKDDPEFRQLQIARDNIQKLRNKILMKEQAAAISAGSAPNVEASEAWQETTSSKYNTQEIKAGDTAEWTNRYTGEKTSGKVVGVDDIGVNVQTKDGSKVQRTFSGVQKVGTAGEAMAAPAPAPAPASVPAPKPEVTSADIQRARTEVKEMDSLFKTEETPQGPVMLYSGIPAEKVAESVKVATKNLTDKLGIPEKDVTIVQRPEAKQPGLITPFKSPSAVARKYPEVKPYVDDGIKAIEVQERLRNIFSKRLDVIDKVLAGGKSRLQDPLRSTYKQNKADLWEILLTGDMLGKRFAPAELRSEFGANDTVIRAYTLIRSAYDHAYTVASKVRELRGKDPINYREGYIPHFFHDWFIIADGQLVASARTMREAVEMSNPLARKGIKIDIVPKQFEFPGADVQAAILGDISYFKLKDKIEKDFGISREEAEALLEGVARMKGRSRFVGNFLQRKGAKGWEKNLDLVNRHYFNMISRYVAMDRFKSQAVTRFERMFGAFDKEHTGVAKYVKDYINDVNGVPTQVENLLNNTLAKVPALSQFLGKYLGDRPSLQLASATTNAVAIAKLGFYNVSSALVNATQLINTYAKLGEKWTLKGLVKATHLTERDKGILKQIGVDVQLGLESGAGYSKAAQVGRLFRNSIAIFQAVEKKLRSTAGLGAYYKALAEGKTHKEAIEYARQIVDLTNYNYSVADTPAFIRRSGPVGQVLFQFKKYPVKTLEFITQLRGAEHARFWIPLVLISGYYAFPGMETIKNVVKSIFDVDIELESKKYLMEWAGKDPDRQAIARAVMYGAFGPVGADISRRVGMGDYIPSKVEDLFGPTASTVVRAAQLTAKREWVEALRAISPAPGNLLLTLQKDGEISDPWNRDRLKIRLEPGERALKAVGFTPARESIERDKTRVVQYAEEKRRKDEQEAIDNYIRAKQSGDSAQVAQAVKRLVELKIKPDRVKEEMEKKRKTPSQRTLENVPKKQQKDYKEIRGFQ